MKTTNYFLAMLALCGTFTFVSCGDDDPEPDNKDAEEALAIQVTADPDRANTYYSDDLKFEVNEDGTTVTVFGKNKYNSWETDIDRTREITIPQTIVCGNQKFTVTAIGGAAFKCYSKLERVKIPETIESAAWRLPPFVLCPALKEAIYNKRLFVKLPASHKGSYTIPDGIQILSGAALVDCLDLTELKFPASLTEVEAVLSCGLTTLTLPSTVTKVTDSGDPICNCPNLTYFDFGKNIKKIDISLNAQQRGSAFKEYIIRSTTPPEAHSWIISGQDISTVPLRVPAGSVEAYKAHEVWGQFPNIMAL